MKTFTEHAHDKMMDLFKNHTNEVGRELKILEPVKYKGYKSTDCITYILNVLSYAFERNGNAVAAKHVWTLGKRGTELAKYLVTQHGWKGVYINPDSAHPIDADAEHNYTSHIATKTCKYYQIPLAYKVQNYNVTAKTHVSFQMLNKKSVTTLNPLGIASLNKVKFGFGVSRGGMHTWMFSKGKVYEVHWDQVGSGLYGTVRLKKFGWISGAIVIPKDQSAFLAISTKLKCSP